MGDNRCLVYSKSADVTNPKWPDDSKSSCTEWLSEMPFVFHDQLLWVDVRTRCGIDVPFFVWAET